MRAAKAKLEAEFLSLLGGLRPNPAYLALFRAVVLDAWDERERSSRAMRAALGRKLTALRERLDRLEEAFLFERTIDQPTYQRQRDRIRQQVALAELELDDARIEQLDVEGVLGFAEQVLTEADSLWTGASFDQRLKLQGALFPKGLQFDGSGFGTPVTCLAFGELQPRTLTSEGMASPTGFEADSHPGLSSQPVDQPRKDNDLRRESDDGNRRK